MEKSIIRSLRSAAQEAGFSIKTRIGRHGLIAVNGGASTLLVRRRVAGDEGSPAAHIRRLGLTVKSL